MQIILKMHILLLKVWNQNFLTAFGTTPTMFCISYYLLKRTFTIICDNDLIPLPCLQKTTIWSGRIFFIGCYLGIFTSCLYCIIVFHFHHFNVFVENFPSYVLLYLYVCWCLVCVCQTKTKKLLTYLLILPTQSNIFAVAMWWSPAWSGSEIVLDFSSFVGQSSLNFQYV